MEDKKLWEVRFRYEHHHQEHCITFDLDVVRDGLSIKGKMISFEKGNALAKPTKRLFEIINSKSQVYDFSIKAH